MDKESRNAIESFVIMSNQGVDENKAKNLYFRTKVKRILY